MHLGISPIVAFGNLKHVNNRCKTLSSSYSPFHAGEKLCTTLPSHGHICVTISACSLIEQSQCNDLKREVENTTGIIPGDRGMVDDSWCWQPLCAQVFCGQQAYITSSFVGFVTDGNTNQELSDKARLETAAESSQVCREFRSAY